MPTTPPSPPEPPGSNSETTFGDRLARGRTMQSKIAGFAPAFAPDDADLAPAAFSTFLDSIQTKNTEIAEAEPVFSQWVTTRRTLYETIKERTLQVVDTISGNKAWNLYLPKVKEYARMIRNTRPPKAPADAPADPNAPAKPKRKTGQQSFGDIDLWFEKLIEAVKLVPGYGPPPESNIQVAQLTTLLTDYRTANKKVAELGAPLSNLRRERLALYDGDPGLRTKMKAIKKSTSGQYGRASTHYAEVKGIGL